MPIVPPAGRALAIKVFIRFFFIFMIFLLFSQFSFIIENTAQIARKMRDSFLQNNCSIQELDLKLEKLVLLIKAPIIECLNLYIEVRV